MGERNKMESRERLKSYESITSGVEGWLTRLSLVLWDILLEYQNSHSIRGNLMEIGAWHGKSAAMLAIHTRDEETLFVFDIEARQELQKNIDKFTQSLSKKIVLEKANSFTKIKPDFCNKHYRSMRWIHIDGDHSQYGIYNDLEIANSLLSPHGLIVVDDFLNERFPQVSEVTFEFISIHKHQLCLLISAGNKGYLVHPKFRDIYYKYLEKYLLVEIQNRDYSSKIFMGSNSGYPCFCIRSE